MTALTVHAPAIETFLPPRVDEISDLSAIASAIADLPDTLHSRRAVAAITATIAARTGHGDLAPDARDVPLVVRQREFAVAARRLDLSARPSA